MAKFDKSYWEDHWRAAPAQQDHAVVVNPYLPTELADIPAGTVLDAGCGTGTEAMWLADHRWDVTAADISATALATARARAAHTGLDTRIEWIEADLARWEPDRTWDLVVTSYAHADIGQLALYRRITEWVAPGGTILIIGHTHDDDHSSEHGGNDHPEDATATLKSVTTLFRDPGWQIDTASENTRTVHPGGVPVTLRDVIVRAHRLT